MKAIASDSRFRTATPALLLVLIVLGSWSQAATPASAAKPTAPGELRFRRVYFPEGSKAWAKGNEKYLPMDAEEFHRLVEAAQRSTPGIPSQAAVGFVDAEYEAQLKGSSLQGTATLAVSPSIPSSLLLSMEPCNLAIARPQWITSDGAPAMLGVAADGKLQILAERSGQLKFDWSFAGQRDGSAALTFDIALPPSPVNRLRVELPADLAPTVDNGVVRDDGPTTAGVRRWRLELGGRSTFGLRLAKPGSEDVRPQRFLARQAAAYDFSLHGVDLSVKLNVEDHREPLRRIRLDLDPELELVQVLAGDAPLAFAASRPADHRRQATVELPPPLQTGPVELLLRAIAPLPSGGSSKLPRLVAADAVCRTSTIRLSVPSPLCIEHLETRGCQQTAAAALSPSMGEQFDFEIFAADAEISLALAQRPTEVRAVSGTQTVLGQGKMTSRVVADFRTAAGPAFSLEAEMLPTWTIDSVRSQPVDVLDDWSQENRGGKSIVSFRLARPLTSSRSLRLIVLARRIYAYPGRNLGIEDVVPLRFQGLAECKRWVDLRATGGNELHITAARQPRRADVKELTAAELDLFADPPDDLLFRDDRGAAELRLSLQNRRPTYSATVRVEAVVADGALAENYTFACVPAKGTSIDRLVVRFAARREDPLTWSVTGMDESHFSTRRWTARRPRPD